jgi:fucose 4-O-acetylase-like acetyltransferase
MRQSRNRIAKWDNLKFVLILSVVLGHMYARFDEYDSVRKVIFFIYSYHMPAFVFISGLFAKKAIDGKRYDKIFHFLLLFLVTKLVLFVTRSAISGKQSLSFLEINDVSWYAFAVFVFYLVTIFLKQYQRTWVMAAAILFACFAGYTDEINTFLSASRIITFYPFFLAGYYMNPQKILEVTNKSWVKAASVLYMLSAAILISVKLDSVYWLLKILKGKTPYSGLKHLAQYGFFLRMGWYLYAGLFIVSLIALMPSVYSIFSVIGSRTMQVYCLHYIPMLLFFDKFKGGSWLQRIWPAHFLWLVLLAGILVTCVLAVSPFTVAVRCIVMPERQTK